jgi:hypothetical protein
MEGTSPPLYGAYEVAVPCITPLLGNPVVLSAVMKVLLVDAVPGANFESPLRAEQGQVFVDPDAAVVEEYVMVGTQTEDVVRRVGSVVGCSEWSDVCGLSIGTGKAL